MPLMSLIGKHTIKMEPLHELCIGSLFFLLKIDLFALLFVLSMKGADRYGRLLGAHRKGS